MAICLYNLRHMNNIMQMQSAMTILATAFILIYRIATNALYTPFEKMKTWDTVVIVNIVWCLLAAQFIFEILSYTGVFNIINFDPSIKYNNKFVYNKPKAKTEDYYYDPIMEEPFNLEDVKLSLARSLSHILLNHSMLIIILLMRPHNVIMVPSVYITCVLTTKLMDHKLLDNKPGRRTEVVDTLSQTLVHLWIGFLFFFYQVS